MNVLFHVVIECKRYYKRHFFHLKNELVMSKVKLVKKKRNLLCKVVTLEFRLNLKFHAKLIHYTLKFFKKSIKNWFSPFMQLYTVKILIQVINIRIVNLLSQ